MIPLFLNINKYNYTLTQNTTNSQLQQQTASNIIKEDNTQPMPKRRTITLAQLTDAKQHLDRLTSEIRWANVAVVCLKKDRDLEVYHGRKTQKEREIKRRHRRAMNEQRFAPAPAPADADPMVQAMWSDERVRMMYFRIKKEEKRRQRDYRKPDAEYQQAARASEDAKVVAALAADAVNVAEGNAAEALIFLDEAESFGEEALAKVAAEAAAEAESVTKTAVAAEAVAKAAVAKADAAKADAYRRFQLLLDGWVGE